MRRRTLLAALAASACLALPALAGTDSTPAAGPTVRLEVTVIEMSNGAPGTDPALKPLQRHFAKSFKNYKTFKYVASHKLSLSQGKTVTQRVGAKTLAADYLGDEKKLLRVQVKFDGARMTMKVRSGGLWFHAGRRGKDGKVTVLALRATR